MSTMDPFVANRAMWDETAQVHAKAKLAALFEAAAHPEFSSFDAVTSRRRFSNKARGVPGEMLAWCARQAETHGCSFLRLDCDAQRGKLRRLYEGLGFRFHSERSMGLHTVARYECALRCDERS
jgi:hypothetical protein